MPNPPTLLARHQIPASWACRMFGDWFRVEVEFMSAGCIEARLYEASGQWLIDSLSFCDPGIVPGGVAVRSQPGALFDTIELTSISTPSVLCGDCDNDGSGADILDALEAAQLVVGIGVPTSAQLLACDVDSSGTLSVLDSLLMAQAAVGLPVSLTCP